MSQVVDERIVEMRFDNENFEKNVQTSLNTLEELKKSLKFENADKSFSDLSKAANDIDFSNLDKNIQTIADRFSTTGIATMKIITDVTALAERSIGNILSGIKSMISTGGLNRALKIEKAKFQLKGLGIAWKDIKEDIDYGVNDTAYGLDAAANVASQLVASGIKLGDNMKSSLRAISGVAAMTSSSYEDIGAIFTTVAGQGKLMTMQLRQLEQRGLNAAATIGKSMGKTEAEIRDLVSEGKIGFSEFAEAMDNAFGEHAKEANTTFTGAVSNIKSAFSRIGELFYSPLLQDNGPVVQFLNIIRTNVNEFKSFVAPIISNITKFLAHMLSQITAFGAAFKKLSGWKNLWQGILNILKSIYYITIPIVLAFKDLFKIFNSTFFAKAAEQFKNFTEHLLITKNASQAVYAVSLVLVAALKIVGYTIQFVVRVAVILIQNLGSLVTLGGSLVIGLLDAVKPLEKISNLLYKLTGLKSLSDVLSALVDKLKAVGSMLSGLLITAIGVAAIAIQNLLSHISTLITNGLAPFLSNLRNIISSGIAKLTKNITKLIDAIRQAKVLSKAVTVLQSVGTTLFYIAKAIAAISITAIYNLLKAIKSIASVSFGKIQEQISAIFNDINLSSFEKVIETIKTFGSVSIDSVGNVLSGIGVAISKLINYLSGLQIFSTIKGIIVSFAEGLKKAFKTVGEVLIAALSGFGTFGKGLADFISNILSQAANIDLTKVIIMGMATAMLIASIQLEKAVIRVADSAAGFIDTLKELIASFVKKKTDALSDSMIKIAKAIGILSAALFVLSKVPISGLIKAGAAITALGTALFIFYKQINKIEVNANAIKSISGISALFISLSASVVILAGALKLLESSASSETLGSQMAVLGAIIISLTAVAVVLSKHAPELTKGSGALLLFSLSVGSMAKAISKIKISENTNIVASLEYFGTILLGLMALISVASRMSLSSAVGVVLIASMITKVADAIKLIGESDLDFNYIKDRYQKFVVILGFITAISLATKVAGQAAVMGAAAAVIIAYGINKIIDAVNIIKDKVSDAKLAEQATSILATAVVGIAGLLALASVAGKSAKAGAVGILLISASLSALIGVVTLLVTKIQDPSKIAGILTITTVLTGLVSGMVAVTKMTEKAKTGPLLAMIIVIAEVVTSLTILSVIAEGLVAPTIAFCAVLLSLGKSMKDISAATGKIKWQSILTMIATTIAITGSLYLLKNSDPLGVLAAVIGFRVCLVTLAQALNYINKQVSSINKTAILTFAASTISLIPIAGAMKLIAGYDWTSLLASAIGFRVCLVTLAQVMSGLSKSMSVKPTALVAFIASTLALIPVAISIRMIASYDWARILSSAVGLSATIVALGAATKLAAMASPVGALTLVLASASLLIAAQSISMIASYDWEHIKSAMIAMVVTIGAVAGISYLLGAGAEITAIGVGLLAAALLSLSVPMWALASVGLSFAAAITSVTNALMYLATVNSEALNNITTAIQSIGLAIGQGLANILVGFASTILSALGSLVGTVIKAIATYVPKFISGGLSWIKGLVKGFGDTIGKSTVVKTITGLVSSIIVTVSKFISNIIATGKNLLLGFIKGITDNSLLHTIITVAGNIGKFILTAIKTVLGIHSPSTEGNTIGRMFDRGVVQGMAAEEGKAFQGGQSLANNGLSGLWSKVKSFFSVGSTSGSEYNKGLWSTIKDYAGKIKGAASGVKDIFSGDGLNGVLDQGKDFIKGLIPDIPEPEDITTSFDDLTESASGAAEAVGGSGSGSGSVAEATKKSTNIMDYAADVVEKYSDTYKELFKTLDNGDPLETSKSAVVEFAKTVYEASGGIVEDTEEGLANVLESFQSFETSFKDSIENQLTSFEKFTEEFTDGADTIIDNLDSNKAAVDNWFRYLKLAADNGIDQKTLINLCQAGFSSETYSKLRTYATMSSKQVAMFNQSIAESTSYSADKVTSAMAYLVAKQQEGYGNINSITESWRAAWKSSCDQTYNEIKTVLERAAAIYDEQVSIIKDKFSGTIASFTEFTEDENAQSLNDMKEALQSRIDAANEYSENVAELLSSGAIDQDFADYLLGLGWEEGYSKVKAMAEASAEEVQDLVDTWNTALDMESIIPKDLASQYAATFTEGLPEALRGIAEATRDNILNDPEYVSIGTAMCQRIFGSLGDFQYDESWGMDVSKIWDGYLESAGFSKIATTVQNAVVSPITSEETKQLVSGAVQELYASIPDSIDTSTIAGIEAATGIISTAFASGLIKSIQIPSDAAAGMANGIVDTTEGILTYDQFVEVANNVIRGTKDAISDGRSDVVEEMRRLCREVVDVAEEELDINSPSKVMYAIGSYVDQGFANGIENGSDDITESINKMSDEAISAFSNVIANISDYLENGINAEPVITPVLDMSNMDAGLAYANSLAGKNFKMGSLSGRAYNLMSSIGDHTSDANNTSTGGNSYQFIQNNYSPKALSRVDIYRQTNNQFTRMKGLVEAG